MLNHPRLKRLAPALALFVCTTVYLYQVHDGQEWGGDFALYYQHAANILHGDHYDATNYVFNEHYGSLSPPTYPPIFPFMLVPVVWAFGLNLLALQCFMAGILTAFLAAFAWSTPPKHSPIATALSILLLGLNYYYAIMVTAITSDILFLVWIFLIVGCIRKGYADRLSFTPLVYVTGVLVYLAYGTRSVGLVIIPAWLAYEWVQVRKIRLHVVAALCLTGLLVCLQRAFFHSDQSYLSQVGFHSEVFVQNGLGYLRRFVAFTHNGFNVPISLVSFGLMFVTAAYGMIKKTRQEMSFYCWFCGFYLATILIWPSFQGERFLLPLFPLFVLGFVDGLTVIWNRCAGWAARNARFKLDGFAPIIALAPLLFAVSVSYLGKFITAEDLSRFEGVSKPETKQLFDAVSQNCPETDLVVFAKPRVLGLFANRPSTCYHIASRDEDLWEYFSSIDASYLVEVKSSCLYPHETPQYVDYLRSFVKRNRSDLEKIFENGDFRLFRLQNGALKPASTRPTPAQRVPRQVSRTH